MIAARQFAFWDASERRKATFSLIRDYAAPIRLKNHSDQTETTLSPRQAFANLVAGPDLSFAPQPPGEPFKIKDSIGEQVTSYFVLRNYLNEAYDLYRRRIIDRDLFLSQFGTLAPAVEILRLNQSLVLDAEQDNDLLAALEKLTHDFQSRRRRPRFRLG